MILYVEKLSIMKRECKDKSRRTTMNARNCRIKEIKSKNKRKDSQVFVDCLHCFPFPEKTNGLY